VKEHALCFFDKMFSIIPLKSAARLTPGLQIGLSNVLLYVGSDFVMESREIRDPPLFNAFIAIFHIPVTFENSHTSYLKDVRKVNA